MDLNAVEARLTDAKAFAKLHGAGLFGGRGKKSYAVWSEADARGVAQLTTLRRETFNDNNYAVFAFSVGPDLTADDISRLKVAVADVHLGQIRYDSMSYSRLEPWRGQPGSNFDKSRDLTHGVGDPEAGRYVGAMSDFKEKRLDCPVVIWAMKDGQMSIYPVPASRF